MGTPSWVDGFFNPPSGGNERGVPTVGIMVPQGVTRYSPGNIDATTGVYPLTQGGSSGPGSQTSLIQSFEAGIRSGVGNITMSGAAGQPEMRNYRRVALYRGAAQGSYPNNQLDEEASGERTPKMGPPQGPAPVRLVKPMYEPPRGSLRRSDGRNGRGG